MTGPDSQHRTRRELRAALVPSLLELQARDELTPDAIARAAEAATVDERTIHRWLTSGPECARANPWTPSEEQIGAYYRFCGRVGPAHRHLLRSGVDVPSLSTFRRGILAALPPAERAYAAGGSAAARAASVWLRRDVAGRNDVWEADNAELAIEVLPPRARRPIRPWITVYQDAYSRLIMGWAISDHPSSASALAALGKAIARDPDRGPFGGVPRFIRFDNGKDFLAKVVVGACGALGATPDPAAPYSPEQKGKVERLLQTIDQELLCGLPHWQGGPRSRDGKLLGPRASHLSLDALVAGVDEWIAHYNAERPHSALDRQTPLDRWLEDSSPVRWVEEAELRWTLMASTLRRVSKKGIRFNGHDYVAPEISALVGETLEVRHFPHEQRRIELFRDGTWLCTARPSAGLDADAVELFRQARREEAARMRRRRAAESRRARARIAPITAGGQAIELVDVISERQGRSSLRTGTASGSLEGLIDPGRLNQAAGEGEEDRR